MATKKTGTRTKKAAAPKASNVPTAKAVAAAAAAAETKGQPAPAAVKAAVTPTAAAKPAPVAAKPAAPAAAKPAASAAAKPAPAAAKPTVISQEERQRRIEQAAYFRAEKHGFQGDSSAHWSAAEAEIDADLKRRGIVVR